MKYRHYLLVVLTSLVIASCADDKPPAVLPDSVATAHAVDSLQGKTMHTKRGPADILNDTEKNRRQPPIGTTPKP